MPEERTNVSDLLATAPSKEHAPLIAELVRSLLDDRSHVDWPTVLETLHARVARPLAKRHHKDPDEVSSILMERCLEKWFQDYLDAVENQASQIPLSRYLERRLRDLLREQAKTSVRRGEAVLPASAVLPAPPMNDQGDQMRQTASSLVAEVPSLSSEEQLRLEMALILKEAGYTQSQIGTAMGTSAPTVSRWFKALSAAVAAAACISFGVLAGKTAPPSTTQGSGPQTVTPITSLRARDAGIPDAGIVEEQPAPAFGTLRAQSRPPARVFVDGLLIGNTPLRRIYLPAGDHEVMFVLPPEDNAGSFAERRQTFGVTIVAGETETRFVSWGASN